MSFVVPEHRDLNRLKQFLVMLLHLFYFCSKTVILFQEDQWTSLALIRFTPSVIHIRELELSSQITWSFLLESDVRDSDP
ncbi:hypothetical protein Tco_0438546 [Tanacetum coccineum]